jgi:hypothetical protein
MLTAIFIAVILNLAVTSLAVLFAAGACGWARACHADGWMVTQVLKTQAEHTDLLEEQSEALTRVDENLLIANGTISAVEQLELHWQKTLAQEGLSMSRREVPA